MSDHEQRATAVSRLEIAHAVGPVLDSSPRNAQDILAIGIAIAVAARARPEVLARLRELPERTYANLRHLWPCLADLPVEADR